MSALNPHRGAFLGKGSVRFIASATAFVATSVADVVCNKPAGAASGDLLIAALNCNGSPITSLTATGWTRLDGASTDGDQLLLRQLNGSEGPTFTFTTSPTREKGIAIACYSGALATPPQHARATGTAVGNAIIAPSITPTQPSTLVNIFIADGNTTTSFTPPGGTTERADLGWNFGGIEIVDQAIAAAGATGTRTATRSGSGSTPDYVAYSLALVAA